jgi:hypothetical protein
MKAAKVKECGGEKCRGVDRVSGFPLIGGRLLSESPSMDAITRVSGLYRDGEQIIVTARSPGDGFDLCFLHRGSVWLIAGRYPCGWRVALFFFFF